MVRLEGGEFLMGANDSLAYPEDGEGPVRAVTIDPFWIDVHAVSNAIFAEFVESTGYVTEAERFGWSFVFAGMLPDDFPATRSVVQAPWWRQVPDACWRHPEGQGSTLEERMEHPVVHVSWNDALAYCDWASRRLPTEAEWAFAARGGLEQRIFPWGDEREPRGEHLMNVWQGPFPVENTCADGWYGTAPVDAYAPNRYGLHNMTGNVWEWCADWFDATRARRAVRGGSYLCHDSYCRRYRVAARSSNAADDSAGNIGFRCASDVEQSTAA
jgi:formylglycine-generating enzyme required for sulfatase activity